VEQDSAGISRGQNQLHVLPEDWAAAEAAIAPLLDRADGESQTAQIVVITSDADAAAGISRRLSAAGGARNLRALAATDARRAGRVHRAAPAHIVIGPPSSLLNLLQSSTLKLDSVRVVVLAWVDELKTGENSALEALMTEVPKDAARLLLVSEVTSAAELLVERYARRPRRMQTAGAESTPVSLSFVTTSDANRPTALRRLLDAIDPESATVVAGTTESRQEVEGILRSLGYDGRSNAVRVGESADAGAPAQLIVLYELPATGEELHRVVGSAGAGGARVVALVTPRQISALKRMAGGAVAPMSLPEAAARARSREDTLRDELREVLGAGQFSRELLAIESLLSDYDGAEIAAAALRLLEMERARHRTAVGSGGAAVPTQAMTRLFLNVGEMDGVRAGDIVGAITNEAGVAKTELGRVEVRERGSTVEVATPVANTVIAKLNGVSIRGRRALVKVDEGPPARPGGPRRDRERPPSDRPRRMGPRGPSPERGGSRKR
jgi:ATP-dependent RNA helicase DeaD